MKIMNLRLVFLLPSDIPTKTYKFCFNLFCVQTSEKLEMVTTYLRTTYSYCHWCGVHYEDATDMDSNCPGSTKDEH